MEPAPYVMSMWARPLPCVVIMTGFITVACFVTGLKISR